MQAWSSPITSDLTRIACCSSIRTRIAVECWHGSLAAASGAERISLTSGFARRDVQRELTIAPQHSNIDAVADAGVSKQALQVVDRCDCRVAEGDDDVALAHACGGGGRAFFHRADP